MLILYDLNHNKIAPLKNVKDTRRERELSGDEVLFYFYPVKDDKYSFIKEECYIQTKDNEYVIKEINEGDEWTEFVAKINVETLKGKNIDKFESVSQTCINAVNLAIAGTGWAIGSCDVTTKKRTVKKQKCNTYDVLQAIRSTYRCDFRFDAINKKIYIYQSRGTDKGNYFTDQLNLISLDVQRNSYDYITRLIPVGKDDLTIEKVNGGKKYLENYQYSSKVITAYWEDNRYTVAENLRDDGIERLNELSKPRRAYKAEIIDLAKISKDKYSILDYDLGDTITLVDNVKKIKEKQRIVKVVEYLDEPERNQIEIANSILSLEDLQIRYENSADTVESITTSAGEIVGSKVDGIEWAQLRSISITTADIQDLSVITARIANLEVTTATITQLESSIARITDLETTRATMDELNATNARIDNLSTVYATITNLSSTNARIDNLYTVDLTAINAKINNLDSNKATITQLTAVQAGMESLTANKADIIALTAASGRIDTLEGKTASIETILSKEVFTELANVGKIVAGSSIIAEGAIGSAQISALDVAKLNAGELLTSKFIIVGPNGRLKISGNKLQVFDDISGALRERIMLGVDEANNSALTLRGADGNTILLTQDGLTKAGFTDGYNKIDNDSLDPVKIDIAKTVTRINNGTTTIQGSKVYVDGKTLDVSFSTLKTTVTGQGESISNQATQISALDNAIKLKVDTQTYNTKIASLDGSISSINTSLSKATSDISVLQGQISLKVSQIDVASYVSSRGENLVTNGTGLLGNNTNFSAFNFDGSDAYFSKGSFKDSAYNVTRFSDEIIPVDVQKNYKLSVYAKTNPNVGASYYIGISEFDSDGYAVTAQTHMYFENTLTTLAQDLKPGDTAVYLAKVANWQNAAGSSTHNRSMIFWGYTNKSGYTFPPETYSRYYTPYDMWADGSIDYNSNRITLKAPWNYKNPNRADGVWPAGTQLSNGSSGGQYKYIAASNKIIPGEWTNYIGRIGGIDTTGNNIATKFSQGTAGIKLLFLNNRNINGSTVWYANISFAQDVASQGDLDSAVNRISTAESTITQHSTDISLRVLTSTYNSKISAVDSNLANLTTRVSTAESSISLLQSEISLKVSQTEITALYEEVNGVNDILSTKINELGASITTTAEQIQSKVDKTVIDTLANTVESNYTELSQKNNGFDLEITNIKTGMANTDAEIEKVSTFFNFGEELTIGKSNSPMQMVIDNNSLQIIDNGGGSGETFVPRPNVVAYLNGQKMYIDNLEVLSSLIVGVHKIEKYNDNLTLLRWVGGGV